MKKVYKIYQADFTVELLDKRGGLFKHDHFLPLDDKEYANLEAAEGTLRLYLNSTGDNGVFTILPIYRSE
jgi:hypothetical protein